MRLPDPIPGLGAKGEKPRLCPGVDLSAHTLTPVEGFVLSRVDGTSSWEEICLISGLPAEETLRILRRLRQDKIILGPNDPVPAPALPPPGAGGPKRAAKEERRPLLELLDDKSPVDPADLLSGADLSVESKQRIIRLHRRMKSLAPHELLGVARDAPASVIKRAYYAASKELHPDRYYGKDLGAFREKLGDIFARLTEAFQALDKK